MTVYLIKLGQFFSTTALGVGAVVVAQSGPSLDVDGIVGGTTILIAAVFSLRMVLSAARYERESSRAVEDRLLAQVADLSEKLRISEAKLVEVRVQRDEERRIRFALETAGIVERREGNLPDDEGVSGVEF